MGLLLLRLLICLDESALTRDLCRLTAGNGHFGCAHLALSHDALDHHLLCHFLIKVLHFCGKLPLVEEPERIGKHDFTNLTFEMRMELDHAEKL